MNKLNLNSFLKYGYFIKHHNNKYTINLNSVDRNKYNCASKEELINEAIGTHDVPMDFAKTAIELLRNPTLTEQKNS